MNTKIALESLSLDLKRVALGYYRGSDAMAKRFSQEALKRKEEVDISLVKPYIDILLEQMEQSFHKSNTRDIAEDALMYSTLFQNYCQKELS
jgi:cellobiose-specific phosphotransferase system component IIB